jgi:hypothetical protein
MWWLVAKDAIVAIYKKIGFIGVFVIFLISWIALDEYQIGNRDDKIIELTASLKVQNKAIEDMGFHYDNLQKTLVIAAQQNEDINRKFEEYRKYVASLPLAVTCDAAMNEVSKSAKTNADIWNGVTK